MQIKFPSTDFPPFPNLSISTPEGWSHIYRREALITVIKDLGEGNFSPNVMLSVERDANLTFEKMEEEIHEYINSLPEVKMNPIEYADRDGSRWGLVSYAYRYETAGTLIQVIAYTSLERNNFHDAVRLIGTASPTNTEESFKEIMAIISSTHVEEPPAA